MTTNSDFMRLLSGLEYFVGYNPWDLVVMDIADLCIELDIANKERIGGSSGVATYECGWHVHV